MREVPLGERRLGARALLVTPSQALAQDLRAHVKSATVPYKYRRLVEFVEVLPMTSPGKIRRGELENLKLAKAGKQL